MNLASDHAPARGAHACLCTLFALALGLSGACSGGGGSSSPQNGQVGVPGTAVVVPGVCASGPGLMPGAACLTLTIASLSNPPATLELRVADPAPGTQLLGTVILGGGGLGDDFIESAPGGLELANNLLAAGWRVVDRSWPGGWLSSPGSILDQSARYAVLADWVRENLHTTGVLCAFGNSAGSAEIAYMLTTWDGDALFDAVILASGPPLTRLDYLCEDPASAAWAAQCASLVAPGLLTCGQPSCEPEPTNPVCPLLPPNPQPGELLAQSILRPGATLDYPTTFVKLLLGAEDCTSAVPLALLFRNSVISPVETEIVANTPHTLFSTPEGRDAIQLGLAQAAGLPDSGTAGEHLHARVHLTWLE